VPLLDHVFVEKVTSLPASHNFQGGRGKRLLRAMAARLLPEEILSRPKHGFTVPVDRWFRGELQGELRGRLEDPSSLSRSIFPRGYATRLLDQHVSGRGRHGEVLWALLVMELWHEQSRSEARAPVPSSSVGLRSEEPASPAA
jgi:asparagine synthase (glutamine-hydrolysing)